jgi:hypothetical protein
MDRNQELRIYMKAARAKFDDGNGRHLSEDEMIAYCQERMVAAEREVTRLHILRCDHCLQLFRNVSDFFEPRREDEEEIDQLQIRRAWNDFWPRTHARKRGAAKIVESVRRISFPGATSALAACLLITLGMATVFVWRERQERQQAQLEITQLQNRKQDLEARLDRAERTDGDQLMQERGRRVEAEAQVKELQIRLDGLRQSRQNIPVYSIDSASIRGQQEGSLVSITPATRTFILSLDIYNPNEFPEYAVEIFNQHGQRVKEISGLRPVGIGKTLNLTLDRESLKEGKHLLRLSGRRGGTKKKLEEYSLLLSFSR